MQQKKIPFCDIKHFGEVKIARIWLAKPEVFKKEFLLKKIDVR